MFFNIKFHFLSLFHGFVYYYHDVLKLLVGYNCYHIPILMAEVWLVSPDDDCQSYRLFCSLQTIFQTKKATCVFVSALWINSWNSWKTIVYQSLSLLAFLLPCTQTSDWWSMCQSCQSRWQMYSQGSPQRANCGQWHSSWPCAVFPEPGK